MVTASHNPKQDNGYKVYGDNGAQIIPPMDKAIATAILAHQAPWAPYGAAVDGGAGEAALLAHARMGDPAALLEDYTLAMSRALCRHRDANGNPALPRPGVTYTAMHGVGRPFAAAAFAAFGLPPFTPVAAQVHPDATFPTVAFPNPEEGAGALELAFAAADAAGDSLVLANDPDADRLAVAEWVPAVPPVPSPPPAPAPGAPPVCRLCPAPAPAWVPRTAGAPGAWRVFTGNEVGALLAAWEWRAYLARGGIPSKAVMFASTVSSKFLAAFAAAEGFEFEETLTGFKWMGNAMFAAEAHGKVPLFAFEEAIGFCCGGLVRDKDGVSAAAVVAEMAGVLAREGTTLSSTLDLLQRRYGVFFSNNGYVIVDDPRKTDAIFARLVNEGRYWAVAGRALGGGPLRVEALRDLRAPGYDSEQPGGVPVLATSSGSNMLTYKFDNGVVATLRSSGTEPKLKWYIEGRGKYAALVAKEVARAVQVVVEEMIRPEVHGLKKPAY
jgi:phosphomannomutase